MGISKAKLFRSLGYEPHEGQWLVHESLARRRVVACGARWGKTYCAAYEGVAAALEPREASVGWVAAPTYDLAKRVFGHMQLVVMQHLAHRVVTMNERERWFTIRNMAGGVSEVRAKSADNPVSLLGEALDWLIVDEAARLHRDVWESALSQRLLDRDGWALLISTPRGKGWFCDLFRRGQRGRDPHVKSWSQPTWANPHVDRDRIERERGRLRRGAFDEEYGAVFLGVEEDPCEVCGYPDPAAPGTMIVRRDEDMRYCPECENLVDEGGHTLVKNLPGYGPDMRVIRIYEEATDQFPPALPLGLGEEADEEGEDAEQKRAEVVPARGLAGG